MPSPLIISSGTPSFSLTVGDLIDRTFNNWLYPAGINRPTYDTLRVALGDGPGDLVVATSGRVANIPRDSVLEIDDELLLVEGVSGGDVTVHERGFLDTSVAPHGAGTRVYVDPRFTRKAVFDTVCDIIQSLYPKGLYAREPYTLTVDANQAVSLPEGTKRVLQVLVRVDGTHENYHRLTRIGEDFQEFLEFDPPKVRLFAPHGRTARVVVQKDFVRPTSVADDLTTTCLVPSSLAPHLAQAVAGQLLMSRELPRVQVEEIRRFLSSQGVQVGAALNVGQALLQDFERRHVGAEKRRLAELDPVTFEYTGPR